MELEKDKKSNRPDSRSDSNQSTIKSLGAIKLQKRSKLIGPGLSCQKKQN